VSSSSNFSGRRAAQHTLEGEADWKIRGVCGKLYHASRVALALQPPPADMAAVFRTKIEDLPHNLHHLKTKSFNISNHPQSLRPSTRVNTLRVLPSFILSLRLTIILFYTTFQTQHLSGSQHGLCPNSITCCSSLRPLPQHHQHQNKHIAVGLFGRTCQICVAESQANIRVFSPLKLEISFLLEGP
jgi:hypothetical protein